MLSILNNYQYGFLLVPVVIACRENGLFELLEKKISFLDLVKELKANDGHLRVALNMFESLNWVIRNKKDQYELNPQTNEYKKIPLELSELYIFPIDEYLKGDSGKYSLKKWVERSSKRWNVDDNMIAEFMDGPLVVPLLLGLIDNKMVESSISPAKTLFPKLKPDVETEIYKLFEEQGWIYSDKSSVKYTEAGRFIIDWIIISATIASYRPMLNKIDDILFGDCTAIFQRDQSGNELHFDTLQGFFHQLPTGAEGFPIAAARVGLFPNPDFFQKYPDTIACSRITLNHFERRNYSVRYATENDMPILEKLEQACWGSAMATPTTVLRKRLGQNPKGNLVIEMEGQVVGVVYSQCISAMEDLKTVSADNVHKLHDENGKIIQLLSLNILPSFQDRNLGDHLLEFILQLCTLRSEIDSVVGVTRCKDYIKHSNMTLQEYIELKNDRGMSVDGILSLHQSHGAEIVSLLRDYRSNDKENKGYGVLVKYDLSTRQKRSRMDKPVVESRRSTILRENKNRIEEFVSETIAQLLCKSKADGISMDLPLMEMGLDSADLLELGRQISYRFDIQIEPAFFFEYNTGEKIIAHLSQGSTTIPSDKNNHNATFNQAQHAEDNHTKKNDIAIIGVSCRLPGNISNIDQFWQLLKNETHIVGKIPNSRWQWPVGIDPVNKHQGIDQGGFLDSIEHFDPGFFRISPREAELMDPQQRLLLEMSWECIENAGYSAETYYSSNIGVFIGASGSDYGKLLETSSEEIEAYSSIGSSLAGIPNRISYFYDFDGPSIQIDTACSSSLVAVHEAVKSIKAGECKQALVGAVNIMCHPGTTVAYYKAGMLSKTGKCQTFDSGADGYVRGEGAVMVLLKPLKNALNDQDGIYAVIKGSAINHGGRAGGFTVPNPAKQSSLLISACKSAGISPDMLSYIEAHGTGTPLGDPVEIRGIKQSFTAQIENPETLKPRSCGLGSVKTNIGHLEAAAGLAGVFKVMLSFQHKTLPATLNFNKLNPHISLEGTPLFVVDKTQPWNVSGNQTRKFAGVSSFGSGGTNAHLILEEPPPAIERESDIKPYYLVCLSARSEKALHQRERDLTNWIAGTGKHAKIDDISTNLLFGREHFPYRSAYVVRDTDQLFEELSNVLNGKKVEHAFRETLKSKECENPVSENSGSTIISKLKSNRNIDQKTYRQQLGALAELYVKGFVIDWQSFHNNHWERSLRLPTYPFDKKVVRYTDGKNRTNESQTDKQTDSLSAKAKNKVVRNQAEKRNGVLFLKPHWELKENTRGNGLIRYEKRLLVFCEPTQTFQQELKSEIDQSEYLLLKSPNSNVGERFITYTTTLFSHIQKLVEKKYTGQILIQLVTSDEAGQNGSADSVSLFKGLSGLIKTTNLEYSKVTGQTIIIDSWGSLQQIMDLLAGCGQLPGDQQIRYHGSKRFVARWKEMDSIQQQIIEHQTLNTFNVQYRIENMKNGIYQHPWKDGATYLFTGGAGFIGLVIVEEIVRQAENITLYLTGRSSLNDEKREKLSQLEINGSRIIYKQVDVADRNAVDGLINEITLNSNAMERASGALNGSLNGILHGAGVIRANYIVNKTEEELTEVLSPKIRGTINLDEACKNLDLDFFVLFSSISSSSGVVGQADYAAANAFLDSFAEYRNRLVRENRRNGHTLSLNWPLWEKGGVRIDPENIKLMERQLGVKPMQNSTGINSLYRGVAAKVDQLMVLEGDWEKLKEKWLSNDSSFVTEASKANHYNQAPTENSHVLTEIENSLIEMASGILKISSAELDTDVILNEFGFDSITFTEFSNKINDTLKAEIDPTLFFEYPTIRDVAGYIAGRTNFSDIFPSPHVEPEMKFDTQRSTNPQRTLTEEIAKPKTDLIAIVGISGKFPGAEDIDQFWENLLAGKDSVSEIPRNRWDWREFYGYPHNCQAKWGGFIDGVDEFDPLFFEISPQEAKLMDPQQRFLMTYVWKALEDAGYSGESIRGSDMAIFAGTADLGYGRLINVENTVMEGHFITGTYPTIGPNRMSYFLDIHGPSELIDTACSSSLVAIHKAVRAIRNGDCEMAVAGGVNTLIDPIGYLGRYKAGMLSIDGRCKTFSDRADGYIPGEGVGMIVLKKLSAAEKSGDQIYGVIIGSSQNHGGRANTLTSPNPQAQARLLKTAYQSAENPIDPRTITYIETHGTGTELGDPIEINGLKSAFKDMIDDFGKAPSGFTGRTPGCGLGSVKSNIGHLELAAGIAGVIKVLLQMKHKTLVKTLHCDQVNPYIQLNQSPFYIVQKNQEWATLRDDSGKEIPRRTGISSFGFGGTNAHVVIEEYRQKQE
ncbi:MAG: KR domain-containing protein, partial [bacterium]|nr:KR domain-containing protein [bacterium]